MDGYKKEKYVYVKILFNLLKYHSQSKSMHQNNSQIFQNQPKPVHAQLCPKIFSAHIVIYIFKYIITNQQYITSQN